MKKDNSTEQKAKELLAEIDAKAATQNKPTFIYLAEQSDGLRQMFIRWRKADIKRLENIKSKGE